jgi:hypothetical protein
MMRELAAIGDGVALAAGFVMEMRAWAPAAVVGSLILRLAADWLVFSGHSVPLRFKDRAAYCLSQIALMTDGIAMLASVTQGSASLAVAAALLSLGCRSGAVLIYYR